MNTALMNAPRPASDHRDPGPTVAGTAVTAARSERSTGWSMWLALVLLGSGVWGSLQGMDSTARIGGVVCVLAGVVLLAGRRVRRPAEHRTTVRTHRVSG